MNARRRFLRVRVSAFACGVFVLVGCRGSVERPIRLEIENFGIIESASLTMRPDASSSIGAKRGSAQGSQIVQLTDRIPLRPGIVYGVAFRVTQAPAVEVGIRAVFRTTSPCVLKRTGELVFHNDTMLTVRVGQLRHFAARLPVDAEENLCVDMPRPGPQTFELWYDSHLLASKTIYVTES